MLIIPREVCCNLDQAFAREWLVTNGLGGYASSSIAGANTRRYHGLLVAALDPPLRRTVLLAKVGEEVEVDEFAYRLGTNEYESGTIHPDGYLYLERVELDGMIPTFFYRTPTFLLTKTVWMEHGQNTTYLRYTLSSESRPIRLTLLPFCTYRDAHALIRGSIDWHLSVQERDGGLEIRALPDAVPYRVLTAPAMGYTSLDLWYWRFKHRVEQERGLDAVEDLYLPGQFRASLAPGESITLIATTENEDRVDRDGGAALERERARQRGLVAGARDDMERQLFAAADQFIVERRVENIPLQTVIAGYHWFTDWGRDTMIALEGLTLLTDRATVARDILRTFSHYVDQGMLPNRFPETCTATKVEYNTIDATLWFFHALDRYISATRDEDLLRELFPVLSSVVDWHIKGTRHNIHVDPKDGLLYGGEPGVQLTWMDAKVGDWVVTPRIGKPVEINALWYHSLCLMGKWAAQVGASSETYGDLAARVRSSFDRYWYAVGGYLYDVLDGPGGNDATLRPNQIFALSLADDLVSSERAHSILQIFQRDLLTPAGLRTLSPLDPNFHPRFRGDQRERDGAYHRGIIWPWLIGAYVDACLKIGADPGAARPFFDNLPALLSEAGIGTLGEIHEALPPYRPVGCIAQAWSVAEALRAYRRLF
jgi:predicted glycogen debranching enzyme